MIKLLKINTVAILMLGSGTLCAQDMGKGTLDYKVEMSGNAATGTYAPRYLVLHAIFSAETDLKKNIILKSLQLSHKSCSDFCF